jgi:hypothetical protein
LPVRLSFTLNPLTMKTSRLILAAAVLAALPAVRSSAVETAAPRAEILFDHPEKFTDVKDFYMATDRGRDEILGRIREFMVREAAHYVPEGSKLTVTFTDIDLAGDFEPWRGPQYDEVRIVKDIYPPAFKFTYTLTDSSGRVVKEGSENIRDMNFQMRLLINSNDSLRYEKDILTEWMRMKLGQKG